MITGLNSTEDKAPKSKAPKNSNPKIRGSEYEPTKERTKKRAIKMVRSK